MTVTTDSTLVTDTGDGHNERPTLWDRVGTDVRGAMTADEAMTRAGLNWDVELQPAFRTRLIEDKDADGHTIWVPDTENLKRITERYAVVRTDTDRELSVVSERYKTFSNGQAFEFMDELAEKGDAEYRAAFQVRGGKSVGLVMYMPNTMTVAGDDRLDMFLMLRTSHDGSSRINVHATPVRFFCTNQVTMITKTAKSSWGITHTADVAGKIAEARDSLQLGQRYTEAFMTEIAQPLVKASVSKDSFVADLKMVIRDRPKRDEEIAAIVNLFETSPNLGNVRNTGWGALNAYSEWSEHAKPNRSGAALLGRSIDGEDARIRNMLSSRILARAA